VPLDERSIASLASLLDQPRLDPIGIGVVPGSAVASDRHYALGHHDLRGVGEVIQNIDSPSSCSVDVN
jgi:hypothetical protein